MGLSIEVQNVLALRPHGDPDGNLYELECMPETLTVHQKYDFLKRGYRIFPLDKTIPLVVTHGNQKFAKVAGLVAIEYVVIDKDPLSDEIHTIGKYFVSKLFDSKESEEWLQFLTYQPPIMNSFGELNP